MAHTDFDIDLEKVFFALFFEFLNLLFEFLNYFKMRLIRDTPNIYIVNFNNVNIIQVIADVS